MNQNNNNFNMDFLMNTMTINMMNSSILNSKEELTLNKIVIIFLIIMLNEIKPDIKKYMELLIKNVKEFIINILEWIYNIINNINEYVNYNIYKIKRIFWKNKEEKIEKINYYENNKKLTLLLKNINDRFFNNFILYIEKNGKMEIVKDYEYIIDKSTTILSLNNIFINDKDLGRIYLEQKLITNYVNEWKFINSKQDIKKNIYIGPKLITTEMEVVKFNSEYISNYEYLEYGLVCNHKFEKDEFQSKKSLSLRNSCSLYDPIYGLIYLTNKILMCQYKENFHLRCMNEIDMYLTYLKLEKINLKWIDVINFMKNLRIVINKIMVNKEKFNKDNVMFKINENFNLILNLYSFNCSSNTLITILYEYEDLYQMNKLDLLEKKYNAEMVFYSNTKELVLECKNYFEKINGKDISNENEIKIIFENPNNYNSIELNQIFLNKLGIFEKEYNNKKDRLSGINNINKIYNIKIVRNNNKKIINSKYKEYLEIKDKLNKLLEDDKIDKLKVMDQLISLEQPEEYIDIYDCNSQIICEEIRNYSKPLNTLYLRKEDENILLSTLNNYKSNDIFEEFGIPKKLGILLHGVPGTGKTSTILAIGTYLNLDIYYLSLKGIQTNKDLKLLFDKISKENIKRGMIILEDIDAMTDIVKRRSETKELSISSLLENDEKLTLEYMLNILDGTLCNENNIFVITTNHKEVLDPALYRKGRIDIDIEFKKCDYYQIKKIFYKIFKRNLDIKVLENIKIDEYTPAEIIFRCLECYYQKDSLSDNEILDKFLIKKDK